ncbi:hypothetical protein BD626DRAFT_535849 [Schizophyllum amplum]|uniref:Uncharacterized protein n=1 Tax=Schizophyllum amplum TaxID=97359 RepID=A0A550CKZ0_9AGAR|nr:hypothetical protein BD626DRAFT_535849 [Auriculariopsis ampla]
MYALTSSPPSPGPVYDVAHDLLAHRRVKPLPKRRRISPAPDGAHGDSPMPQPPQDLPHDDPQAYADDPSEGDYIDHLQQPGNTKKRKVPKAGLSGAEDEPDRGGGAGGGGGGGGASPLPAAAAPAADLPPPQYAFATIGVPPGAAALDTNTPATSLTSLTRRLARTASKRGARLGRALSLVTLAGLQHKDMLRTRKRQLTAVLGALSQGDAQALDQALEASWPLGSGASGYLGGAASSLLTGSATTTTTTGPADDVQHTLEPLKTRKSKRPRVRAARRARANVALRHPDAAPFPTCEFLHKCPSATAERLITTKEEVNALRARFEAELARQASKAAQANKMALASRRAGAANTPAAPDRDRKSRLRTTKKSGAGGDQKAEFLALPPQAGTAPGKPAKGKKKKRSALANASNPHHLRNYVPSRLPHAPNTNAGSAAAHDENVPIGFLSKGVGKGALISPADEWVCPFCEYELFYGDEAEYRRAIRNRKKILRRRRRARERASAAASGQGHGVKEKGRADGREEEDEEEEDEGYEEEALYDPPADTYAAPAPVQQKWDPGRGVGKGAQAATG